MTCLHVVRRCVVALLLVPYASVLAQEVSPLKTLVDGTTLPNKMLVRDMTDEFWPVMLTLGGGNSNDVMAISMSFAMMGRTGSDPQARLFRAMQISWTKGQVIRIGDASFLATYRLGFDPNEVGPEPNIDKVLNLVLVKPDSITAIGAVPDYKVVDFQRALGVRKDGPLQIREDRAQSLGNLKQIALGVHLYASDWNDEIPYVQSVKSLQFVIMPYLKNNDLWKNHNPNGGRFLMNMSLAGVNLSNIERPAETPMLYDEREWPDGTRLVAYADGHVKAVTRDAWSRLQPMLKLKLKRSKKPLPNHLPDTTAPDSPEPFP